MDSKYVQLLQRITNLRVQGALQAYAQEIAGLDKVSDRLSKHQIFRLLLMRDAVEQSFQQAQNSSIEERSISLAIVSGLDSVLKQQAAAIVRANKLADCRQSRRPPETAWWWWLEPYVPDPSRHKLNRFDWLWNILSGACLVLSASYLTITMQAFSVVGGFDLLQTLSTLSQATGLALVAGGTLTNKGHEVVKQTLKKLNIPSTFHSEAILGGALFMLLVSYSVHTSLPRFSDYYYQKGLIAQKQGNLYVAIDYFKEAIAFNPKFTAPHTYLAEVYQNLERFEQARVEYQDGLLKGDVEAINGLGSLILAVLEDEGEGSGDDEGGLFSELLDAEVLFRIGLNQVEADNDSLKAKLHTNLGITLLKRAIAERDPDAEQRELIADSDDDRRTLLADAREHLEEAIRIEQRITGARSETYGGQGIAYCFLAGLYEQGGQSEPAAEYWQTCEAFAYPASMEQYEDIMRLGGSGISLHLNTKHILQTNPQ